jgi:cytidine deaminase
MTDPDRLARWIELAQKASENAYCPYSHFAVGAVVVTASGDEFAGCNVENASFGLTICAERNAIFQMVAKSQQPVRYVVIYTPTDTPTAPCGACRQVIHEFGPDAIIVSVCKGTDRSEWRMDQLLPAAFGPVRLGKT